MTRAQKAKKLEKFAQKNSLDQVNTPVWPRIIVRHGKLQTYVRIERHRIMFLVHMSREAEGIIHNFLSWYEHMHFEAFEIYKHFRIDLNTPFLEGNIPVPFAYYDVNQNKELDEERNK